VHLTANSVGQDAVVTIATCCL